MLSLITHLEKDLIDYGKTSIPTTDSEAWRFIKEYLIKEDFQTPIPISHEQINTEMLIYILLKYSPRFRKEWKKWKKSC